MRIQTADRLHMHLRVDGSYWSGLQEIEKHFRQTPWLLALSVWKFFFFFFNHFLHLAGPLSRMSSPHLNTVKKKSEPFEIKVMNGDKVREVGRIPAAKQEMLGLLKTCWRETFDTAVVDLVEERVSERLPAVAAKLKNRKHYQLTLSG